MVGILLWSEEADGGYTAFCFDEACHLWGNTLMTAMETAKGKTDAQRRGNAENILRRYLGLPPKFADIGSAARAKKPEDRPEPPFRMEH